MPQLNNKLMLDLLAEIGQNLSDLGLTGEILLTGGASMCLVHSARDFTKDIDALYEPKKIINQIVSKIAIRENLPVNWLNDGVKGFISPNASIEPFLTLPGLKISTVSPHYLLSMKLMASRYGNSDYEDIKFLMKKLQIYSSSSAISILSSFFPDKLVMPRTQYVIEDLICSILEEKSNNIFKKID